MDLQSYRNKPIEQERVSDLLALVPNGAGSSVIDIGARDGFISLRLAETFDAVVALDLNTPTIAHERVRCIRGDVTALDLPDGSFDVVLCTEVLEHIPPPLLQKACSELQRVSKRHIVVGVPYRQDRRVGRTTCAACGRVNPPWGHLNTFDERRLRRLFASCAVERESYVGSTDVGTNAVSTWLMDLAGNPDGTYAQDEPCVHCGAVLTPPAPSQSRRQLARLADWIRKMQRPLVRPHANWIHVLFDKSSRPAS
ncbi:MAG: class I SAM-dependent methyltransferase [Candidatus Krumholzibacteria bacterium]|nr:class I SAM-dependent methyltransferase [Candidatus Krumholzibacteria bacterium]